MRPNDLRGKTTCLFAVSAVSEHGECVPLVYDADDFPTFYEVRTAISWQTAILPLPAAEQWKRISVISPDLAATMEATTNERIQQAVLEARKFA